MKTTNLHSVCQGLSVTVLVLGAVACGSSKKADDTTTPAKSAITASYTSAGCASSSCHGSDGSATPGGATAGKGVLKSTKLTADAFKTAIRNGQGTAGLMAKYTTAQMSDADITTNYSAFTGK